MQRVKNWILAFRPKTLTAALVPIIAATALVKAMHFEVKWWVSISALVASLFIQIGTNLVNDAIDFKKGADTKDRIGPKRVTQSGVFQAKTVLFVGTLFFILAIAMGIPLVLEGGLPIVLIGFFSILCGYIYTAGPYPLAYTGLGDIFVILFFGLIAVGGVYFLQTGNYSFEAFLLGLQIGLHCTVLIAINNLRDINTDKLVNKKTLPVRFGVQFARFEIYFLVFLPFILSAGWIYLGFYKVALASYLAVPLAIKIIVNIFKTEPSEVYNKYLGQSAALHLIFGLLISIGFLI